MSTENIEFSVFHCKKYDFIHFLTKLYNVSSHKIGGISNIFQIVGFFRIFDRKQILIWLSRITFKKFHSVLKLSNYFFFFENEQKMLKNPIFQVHFIVHLKAKLNELLKIKKKTIKVILFQFILHECDTFIVLLTKSWFIKEFVYSLSWINNYTRTFNL